ncbi:MAG: TPM domain-containing protein [Muribaculaceae bacterium]|nr:TPM domain-containing protein [Muribaculaceae bacterium]
MKLLKIVLIALACFVGEVCMAQVPEKPDSMMPIYDEAGIFKNDSLVNALNTRLDSLSRRTTNQIVVVTVNDLGKLEANQFATQLGKKWGIGDKKLNNGLIILVKPRNDKGPGEVYLAPGRGIQGVLPDVKCRYITDSIMVPHFKEGDYASGIVAAIDYIEPIVIEEYEQIQAAASQNNDSKSSGGNGWWILGGIAAGIGGLALLRKRNKKNQPQQPTNGEQTTAEANTETAAVAATGAASALADASQQEENDEPEPENEESENEEKPEEPEAYKYKYGGGDFDGGGAGSKF